MKLLSEPARGGVLPLRKDQIEAAAQRLLAEFGRRHGAVTCPPVPVEEVVELHLGLVLELQDLQRRFAGAQVLGAIWMTHRLIAIDLHLDPTLYPERQGRFHFTLAHEAGHWQLHRRYFLGVGRSGGAAELWPYICRSTALRPPVEWQADYFAACLLMPQALLRREWQLWHRRPAPRWRARDARATQPARPPDCQPLADRFGVSLTAMRLRLQELGLLHAGAAVAMPRAPTVARRVRCFSDC